MAKWYAVYFRDTGKLKSVGTVITNPPRPEYVYKEVGDKDPTQIGMVWNEKTLEFEDKEEPVVTAILDSFLAKPELSKLTTNEKDSFRTKLKEFLYEGKY